MTAEKVYLYFSLTLAVTAVLTWLTKVYGKAKAAGVRETLTVTDINTLRQGNTNISLQLDKIEKKVDKYDEKLDKYVEKVIRLDEKVEHTNKRIDEHLLGVK